MIQHTSPISDKFVLLSNETRIPFDRKSQRCYQKLADLIGDARIVFMG